MNKQSLFGFCAVFLIGFYSCQSSSNEKAVIDHVELVIVDSLVIDHLGQLYMIDLKEDGSEYLLFDALTKDLLRVDSAGEILQKVNRTGEGKDNYQSGYFFTAQYLANGDIMVETYGMQFIYDENFALKEKRRTPFNLITNLIGGSTVNLPIEGFMFSSAIKSDDPMDGLFESYAVEYPLLTAYHLDDFSIKARAKFPEQSQMVLNPGQYNFDNPFALYYQNELYLNYAVSPQIYIYDFPSLELKRVIELNPGENYKQNIPSDPNENFGRFFNALASSTYEGFNFSNGYLIAWYKGAVPKEEVDALPRNVVGQPEYRALQKKYESTFYQIFDGDKKLWEGQKDIKLSSCRNLIYSKVKEGEEADQVEKDYETFYFYGVNID